MKIAVVILSVFLVAVISGCTENVDGTTTQECNTADECATGGCSNEICGIKGIVEDEPSACVWIPQYNCLVHTTCSCINHKCEWQNTTEYQDCLENDVEPSSTASQ